MSNSLKYKIIGDSCLDLTEELKRDPHFQMIPLTLQVDDVQIVDDETFDQKRFLELHVLLLKPLSRHLPVMRKISL